MIKAKRSSRRPKAHLVFLVGAFLTASLAIASHAHSTGAWAKSAHSRSNGSVPQAKARSLKATKTASEPRPSASIPIDLLRHLEEGQMGFKGRSKA